MKIAKTILLSAIIILIGILAGYGIYTLWQWKVDINLPENFVKAKEKSIYDFKALSYDLSTIGIMVQNADNGTLDFWTKHLESKLLNYDGYKPYVSFDDKASVIRDATESQDGTATQTIKKYSETIKAEWKPFKSEASQDGKFVILQNSYGGEIYIYVLSVIVKNNDVITAEFSCKSDYWDQYKDLIEPALATVDANKTFMGL